MSLALLPGPMSDVFLPPILKSWPTWPAFLTVNVTEPCGTLAFESLNLNSDAVTVTAVPVECERAASDGPATTPTIATSVAMKSETRSIDSNPL